MKITSYRVTFGGVLCLLGLIYFSLSFLTGEAFFTVPNSWFVTWMANIFQQMDAAGFFNVWSGQSQGFNYLYYIIWKPAIALAEGQDYFALIFSSFWLFITIGSFFLSAYLFYKIVAEMRGHQKGIILGTIFILFFLTMPDWYSVIDLITIAGLLGAIYSVFRGRSLLGGIILGVTATFKPLGLLLLPVILKSELYSWKARVTMVVTSVISFGVVMLPLAIGNFKVFMSSFHWQSGRPPWETVYAFAMYLLKAPHPSDKFFQDYSGIMPRDWGWTGITPHPSLMTTPVPAYSMWYSTVSTVLIIAVTIAFLLLKRIRTREEMMLGILCILGAYFAFFYGWSLQFVFWLIPFLLLSFPLSTAIAFRFIIMLEYPFFFALYLARVAPDIVTAAPGLSVSMTSALAPFGPAAYWSTIVIRTLLILSFGIIAWVKLPTRLWNPIPEFMWPLVQKFQIIKRAKGEI